jgi:hypothetical protein
MMPSPIMASDTGTAGLPLEPSVEVNSEDAVAPSHIMNATEPIANTSDSPPTSLTNVTSTATAHPDDSESTVPSHLPAIFEPFLSGSVSNMNEEALKTKLLEILTPFGVRRLVNAAGTCNNKNPETKSLFPHRYFTWVCGTCDKDVAQKSDEENGCCGLNIHCCIRDSKDDDEPHIFIKNFKLPFQSRHLQVSAEVWNENDHVIKNEDELTPTKIKLLKSLGTSRVPATKAREIMQAQYEGVRVSDQCMYRMFKKGRNEKFGALESESMTILFSCGHKLREFNDKYGLGGKFETILSICPTWRLSLLRTMLTIHFMVFCSHQRRHFVSMPTNSTK